MVYGVIRNEHGEAFKQPNAVLILKRDGKDVAHARLGPIKDRELNYEINVRLDQGHDGSRAYSPQALRSNDTLQMMVVAGDAQFRPVRVQGSLILGQPGGCQRVDLEVAEDLDKDGLPDVWEAEQLRLAGHAADNRGKWPLQLVTADDDLDGNGQSNWQRYAATLVSDGQAVADGGQTPVDTVKVVGGSENTEEALPLKLKERSSKGLSFEFVESAGKTYSMETSPDGKQWSSVPFTVGDSGAEPLTTYQSKRTGTQSAVTKLVLGKGRDQYRFIVRSQPNANIK